MAAKESGRSYTELIGEIVDMAMTRSTKTNMRAKSQGA
jgi:hypothetical protein